MTLVDPSATPPVTLCATRESSDDSDVASNLPKPTTTSSASASRSSCSSPSCSASSNNSSSLVSEGAPLVGAGIDSARARDGVLTPKQATAINHHPTHTL